MSSLSPAHMSLSEFVRRSGILPGLDESSMSSLMLEATVVELYAGQVLFSAGDVSDAAYVLLEGSLQIYVCDAAGGETVLDRLEAGRFFGEQGIASPRPRPRNASVRAIGAARVIRLPMAAFSVALAEVGRAHLDDKALRDAAERLAATSSIGRCLPWNALHSLALTQRTYAAGATVFRQGDRADEVFVIERGAASVLVEEQGRLVLVSRVEQGGFFGERGVMRGEARSATVIAESELTVLVLDGAAFRAEVSRSPQAVSFLAAFEGLYRLPRRGVVVQGRGELDGQPAATALYHLLDGRQVVVARTLVSDLVVFRETPLAEDVEWFASSAAPGVRLGSRGARLVAIEAGGEWPGLAEAALALLEGEAFDAWRQSIFVERGALRVEAPAEQGLSSEVLCACTGVTLGELEPVVALGGGVERLCASTGAGTVCGSCRPRLMELCGSRSMYPVQIAESSLLAQDIHRFRIVGAGRPLPPAPPGAHTVLEGLIDGHWVRRSYTLTGLEGGDRGWELAIKREPHGLFSGWLTSGRTSAQGPPGPLRASPPSDGLPFVGAEHTVVCFVAGVGVTPAVALARGGVGRPLVVHQSVRTVHDAAYADEFRRMDAAGRIRHRLLVTSESSRIDSAEVRAIAGEHPDASFVVCGPGAYEDAVCSHLVDAGIARDRIHVERFHPAGAPARTDPIVSKPSLPAVCPVNPGAKMPTLEQPLPAQEEARLLVTQFHHENNIAQALAARLSMLPDTAPFDPDTEELSFAARVAWRNSSRCIGRLYWRGLAVRDRRHVRSPEGMLDEMVEHMRLATNGGRLRSVLTVFAPEDQQPPHILSPQLVRYAGYRRTDGSVLGDPAHLELTLVAEQAGWRGTGTDFDVLPLLVRGTDGQVHRRDLSAQEVLEVPLVHPTLPWFAELGLKWHALPAIADQCLDAFGRRFLVLFNGWYMGTEIGARNLSDPYRYNLLPELAQRMGLDRRTEASMWRDRALVELNVAVLHSFQQAGVTMLDHHTASREFFEFAAAEHGCGRPIQAEWSWMVPPISGSSTPQYHVDFTNIRYKPAFVPRSEG